VAQSGLLEWLGHRGEAGRLPPKGFPKNNKFWG
jgi:topoisomerase-4 subunit A